MVQRVVSILGSTGSIGTHTLEVIAQFPEKFRVGALSAGRNLTLLREQIRNFGPEWVSVLNSDDALSLKAEFPALEVFQGEEGVLEVAAYPSAEIIVIGIVGFPALAPTFAALQTGKTVALASKEVLVVAGELFAHALKASSCRVIPVDSEHNAIFQLLLGQDKSKIRTLVLTASGGPLFRCPDLPLDDVTPALAVQHPNWKMGPKISVDSATLMNKGLELVEAHFLFERPTEQIEIWIHPQSIIHGAICFEDNSCMAQLTLPNMKSSLGFALGFPDRLPDVIPKLSLSQMAKLEFFEPDERRFPALRVVRDALNSGMSHLVALNAANELAVGSFLKGDLLFSQIVPCIEELLSIHGPNPLRNLEDIYEQDWIVRKKMEELLRNRRK